MRPLLLLCSALFHPAFFDEDLVARVSWAEALMRSPEALAYFLEACGKVVLERAGSILEERLEERAASKPR